MVPMKLEGGVQGRFGQDCKPMTTATSSEPVKVFWEGKQNEERN